MFTECVLLDCLSSVKSPERVTYFTAEMSKILASFFLQTKNKSIKTLATYLRHPASWVRLTEVKQCEKEACFPKRNLYKKIKKETIINQLG